MSKSAGNHRKIYVDHPKSKSKTTCIIHQYAKSRPNKDCENYPKNRNKFNRQKDNNTIVNNAVNEIVLQETQKVSAQKGAYENIESDFDNNKLYQINNMSLEETK